MKNNLCLNCVAREYCELDTLCNFNEYKKQVKKYYLNNYDN